MISKKKLLCLICGLLLITPVPSFAASLSNLFKQVGNYNPADGLPSAETSIIVDQTGVINSGKPFTITFSCGTEQGWPMPAGNIPNLIIRDYFSRAVLKQVSWPGGGYRGFAVNQTINGMVHVFMTQDPDNVANANAYAHATLDQNFNIVSSQVIWAGAWFGGGIKAAMGIASINPQGGWSINYENQYGVGFLDWADGNFTPGPKSATNPNGFTNVATQGAYSISFDGNNAQYQASDGYWYKPMQNMDVPKYLLWLTMARSIDRVNWTYPTKVLLTPTDTTTEGTNNSDIRMIEYQGKTYIVYLCGDQKTWSNVRTAIYFGTVAQLRAEFFQ